MLLHTAPVLVHLLVPLLAPPVASEPDLTVAELEALRDEVIPDVEELRGGKFEHPVAVEVTTKEEFLDYALERTDRMQTPEDRAAEEEVAKLLGLIPAEMDLQKTMLDFMKEQVGGFYEPSEKTFYVVSSYDQPGMLKVILVHELTHALDDQRFGIDDKLMALAKTNTDATLAFHAVVEGSGTSVMNRWMLPRVMSGEISMEDMKKAAEAGDFGDAPEFVWLPLVHSYVMGAAFLARTDSVMKGQMTPPDGLDIDTAFEHPPLSTEQVMHPEKYWNEEERDDPRPIEIDASGVGADWALLKSDTLGELTLAIVSREREPEEFSQLKLPYFDSDSAAGWGGDRYALLGKEDARVLHVATSWDTEADADEFEAALEDLSDTLHEAADAMGEGPGGVEWTRGENREELRLTIWSGVDAETAHRVVGGLRVVVPPGQ